MVDEIDPDETVECGGLLGGINAYHLRRLCESPWEGGGGYTPEQVGRMTPDQVWFRLCNLDILKRAGERTKKPVQPEEVPEGEGVLLRGPDGKLRRVPVVKAKDLVVKKEGRRARRRRLKNEGR